MPPVCFFPPSLAPAAQPRFDEPSSIVIVIRVFKDRSIRVADSRSFETAGREAERSTSTETDHNANALIVINKSHRQREADQANALHSRHCTLRVHKTQSECQTNVSPVRTNSPSTSLLFPVVLRKARVLLVFQPLRRTRPGLTTVFATLDTEPPVQDLSFVCHGTTCQERVLCARGSALTLFSLFSFGSDSFLLCFVFKRAWALVMTL